MVGQIIAQESHEGVQQPGAWADAELVPKQAAWM